MAVDIGAVEFWTRPAEERDVVFAELRRDTPISLHEPPEDILDMPIEGQPYWAIVRHEDIRAISRDPRTFCSGHGTQFGDAPPEILEASQSFLAMDAPRHTKLRGLVSAAFTPRQVARIEEGIRVNAKQIVEEAGADRRRGLRRAGRQASAAGDDLGHDRRAPGGPRARGVRCRRAGVGGGPRVLRRPPAGGGARRSALDAHPVRDRAGGPPRRAPRGRPDDRARAGRSRGRATDPRGDRGVLRAALGGGQRHHPPHHLARDARPHRQPRPARPADRRTSTPGCPSPSRSSCAGPRR